MGVLPTYASIGIAASIIFVLLRLRPLALKITTPTILAVTIH
jgi:hypothetical protein